MWALALLLAACSPSAAPEAPSDAPREAHESKADAPGTTLSAEWLQARLHARHAADAPSLDQVRQLEGGFATLQQAVEQAELLAVKARGIALMAAFVPGDAEPWLQSLLTGDDHHPKLHAAALRALADAGTAPSAELLAAQKASVTSADPRVALAAIDGLALTEQGRTFLRGVQLPQGVAAPVQARLTSATSENGAD